MSRSSDLSIPLYTTNCMTATTLAVQPMVKAGITLSKLEPLIIAVADNGVSNEDLVLTKAAGPEILPLLPTIVDLAPRPFLSLLLDWMPQVLLQGAASASFAAAYGVTTVMPDDTVAEVAVQTLAEQLALHPWLVVCEW